jgi:hypothetical protein
MVQVEGSGTATGAARRKPMLSPPSDGTNGFVPLGSTAFRKSVYCWFVNSYFMI